MNVNRQGRPRSCVSGKDFSRRGAEVQQGCSGLQWWLPSPRSRPRPPGRKVPQLHPGCSEFAIEAGYPPASMSDDWPAEPIERVFDRSPWKSRTLALAAVGKERTARHSNDAGRLTSVSIRLGSSWPRVRRVAEHAKPANHCRAGALFLLRARCSRLHPKHGDKPGDAANDFGRGHRNRGDRR